MEKYKGYAFYDVAESDLNEILDIYNYYVTNTTVTFHTEKLSIEQLKEFIFINHPKYKSFLIKNEEDEVCGYSLLTEFKKRQAYDRTAEISIYLKRGFTGKGIGNIIIEFLEIIAQRHNIKVLIGSVARDNKSSIKLFERHKFKRCACFKEVGEKFGKILDVVAFEKILG